MWIRRIEERAEEWKGTEVSSTDRVAISLFPPTIAEMYELLYGTKHSKRECKFLYLWYRGF